MAPESGSGLGARLHTAARISEPPGEWMNRRQCLRLDVVDLDAREGLQAGHVHLVVEVANVAHLRGVPRVLRGSAKPGCWIGLNEACETKAESE